MNQHIEPSLLRRYTEGALDDPEIATVEGHLDHCDACTAQLGAEVSAELASQARILPHIPAPPRATRRRWWAGGGAMALAAAVFLVVLVPSSPPLDTTWSVEMAGGIQDVRSAPVGGPSLPRLAASDMLRVSLRPASPTTGDDVQAQVFAGGARVEAEVEVATGGAIRVSVPVANLGDATVVTIGVGPAGAPVPEVPEAERWQFYTVEFIRVAPG